MQTLSALSAMFTAFQSILGLSRSIRGHMERECYWSIQAGSLWRFRLHFLRTLCCKIWGFHGGHYGEWRLLGYKNPVRTSLETHYVSTTESSQLMLCKIWGFHGSDYEECRLLGYKNPVRTSQVTHYVFATESSHLMLCKIWGFHGGDYEEWRLLGCYYVWLL
jgi:hypothetical protein